MSSILNKKRIFSILIGIVVISVSFYYVYENIDSGKTFDISIYPISDTFEQGKNLSIRIDVRPNTNNFQSTFDSEFCLHNNSAYLEFHYIGINPDGYFNGQSTIINKTNFYLSAYGTVPINISSSNSLSQIVNWNGTEHIFYDNCLKGKFVEANAGYYIIYPYITLKTTNFGVTKEASYILKFSKTPFQLDGLYVNYSISNSYLNFSFNQFHSTCQFSSGSVTIIGANGTRANFNGLNFPGTLPLNLTNLENQLSQKSIDGDIAIVHNRYGNIWLII